MAIMFGDRHEAGLVERQPAGHLREGRGIDIVHEVQLGPAFHRAVTLVLERGQRLARHARAATAHDHDMFELGEALGMRFQRLEIVAPRRQLQQRKRAVVLPFADLVECRQGAREPGVERGLRQDRVIDILAVEHRPTSFRVLG
jgi:hypothetical protein